MDSRDKCLVEAIREFFKNRTLSELEGKKNNEPRRQKFQAVRLSNPGSKAELMKIMDRIRAENLFNFCEKIRRYEK